MAQTLAYSTLVSRIEAIRGESYGTTELARVKSLINMRAWAAYRESPLWENMLLIGEERAVNDSTSVLPWTGAVFDATEGLTDANPYSGVIDTCYRLHSKAPWLTTHATEFQFQANPDGLRIQNYSAGYGLSSTLFTAISSGGTVTVETQTLTDFYAGGTVKISGTDTDVLDINGTHTVATVNAGAYTAPITQLTFTISDTTNNTWSMSGDETIEAPVVWATYKKRLDGTSYGDSSGETTTIPREWFEYIAHGVAADMFRADGQVDSSIIEDRVARDKLRVELERLDAMHTSETVFNRVRTHNSEARQPVTVT